MAKQEEIAIALDPAASEFFQDGKYVFKKSDKSAKSSDEEIDGRLCEALRAAGVEVWPLQETRRRF